MQSKTGPGKWSDGDDVVGRLDCGQMTCFNLRWPHCGKDDQAPGRHVWAINFVYTLTYFSQLLNTMENNNLLRMKLPGIFSMVVLLMKAHSIVQFDLLAPIWRLGVVLVLFCSKYTYKTWGWLLLLLPVAKENVPTFCASLHPTGSPRRQRTLRKSVQGEKGSVGGGQPSPFLLACSRMRSISEDECDMWLFWP